MKAKNKLKDGVIQYGSVEMSAEELREAENPKIRTTMFLEEDLIRAYKREAARRGLKYQQLMREKLRTGLAKDSDVEARLKRLEEKVLKRA
jgi:predicted DNA binding CopG/RHH family protein